MNARVVFGILLVAWAVTDSAGAAAPPADALSQMTLRVRVTRTDPQFPAVRIHWRRGGEGLGGSVTHGHFTGADGSATIPVGRWSAPLPLETVVGRPRAFEFPTITVNPPAEANDPDQMPAAVAVEFEFAQAGKAFKTFEEPAPKGSTVGFAFPGDALNDPTFAARLQGLSAHARARREFVEKLFPDPRAAPRRFGIIGHLAGYGQRGPGRRDYGQGYGVRHCNPEILADECRTLRLLGVNGMVGEDSLELADASGAGDAFRRVFWGGPGAGSPMNYFRGWREDAAEGCPFDPELKRAMPGMVDQALADHRAAGARESWGLWWDEIGVAAKVHQNDCQRCRDAFREYLKGLHVEPKDVGMASWNDVAPHALWTRPPAGADGKPAELAKVDAPSDPADALRYYYSFRFLTHMTAQLFPESAKRMGDAGVRLYAMQGPTPSWTGHSLDWHEFYDAGPNTAFVWETSNRDPRVWQWESYLADIGRGIARRHKLPMGCLVKPHRGAPEQRMLAAVSRGVTVLEWYTYGPDYAKGDSFSQRPDLLERVARAGRFLARTEDRLYESRFAGRPEVAFVSPRSSEFWGKSTDLGVTAFEDAKWVYLALAHAHVPVDVLSEQQLPEEGRLDGYKVLYVAGPNLRRDAAAKVKQWVMAGGVLWTDALGMGRDEANQPNADLADLFGPAPRALETWGTVPGYKATTLEPLAEKDVPAAAAATLTPSPGTPVEGRGEGLSNVRAAVGRELIDAANAESAEVLARFADGRPALLRRTCGKGRVITTALWAGLTYSSRVRRPDFDMATDFDPAARDLIAAAALDASIYRPVIPSEPTVEAVLLEREGKRSIALMNWGYRSGAAGTAPPLCRVDGLKVMLPGCPDAKSVRSAVHGPLALDGDGARRSVTVPSLDEIDLLELD